MSAEGTPSGSGRPSLSPDLIAQRGFAVTRKGFDQGEVRTFLGQVADEVRAMRQREAALEDARRDAEERARHPSFDEQTLISAVGEETASILGSARTAAADIRAKAEDNAARILKEGHERAAAMRDEAEQVLSRRSAEAEAVATRITAAATADAERLRDTARREVADLRSRAEADAKSVVEAAQGARDRILAELTRRRNTAMVQIQQLRAGRDRLLEAYKVVRTTLDEVTGELQRAGTEARAAAEAAARRPPAAEEDDLSVGVLEAVGAVEDVDLRDAPEATPADGPVVSGAVATAPRVQQARSSPRRAGVTAAGALLEREAEPADQVDGADVVDESAPADSPDSAEEGESRRSVADEAVLQRRDEALGDIEPNLARRLKRVLQDEQNALLDRLRGLATVPGPDEVLDPLPAQIERYAAAARPLLAEAARAGRAFAGSMVAGETGRGAGARAEEERGGSGLSEPSEGDDATSGLAGELATAVVVPLRRRLEQALADAGDDDAGMLPEWLGAAYREWKTQRIERAAGDHIATAFSRAAFSAIPEATALRWLVDDVDGPCPDCDDNALAGGLPKGEPFPTGQQWPPAHAGCRCLLVVDPG